MNEPNNKKYWMFDIFLALIVTFVTLGIYLLAYILIQTLFMILGYSDAVDYNLGNVKLTFLILIPTIFFQILILSMKGKFAEKFEKEDQEKKEQNKKNDISEMIDQI